MRLMFCMFAEHVGLLPTSAFSRVVHVHKINPASLRVRLESLFAVMAGGGPNGPDDILRFKGGLFDDSDSIQLTPAEAATLDNLAGYDWANIEPSIFGTLFERILDPDKRSQIGAHYTRRDDIETLLTPVLLAPLGRQWEEVMRKCEGRLWAGVVAQDGPAKSKRTTKGTRRALTNPGLAKASKQRKQFDRALIGFAERLAHVTVLDPACGSGNFLYVALHMLLDLEKEVIAYSSSRGLSLLPRVSPTQLRGIEVNAYAQQLAQVSIWIGYLQNFLTTWIVEVLWGRQRLSHA